MGLLDIFGGFGNAVSSLSRAVQNPAVRKTATSGSTGLGGFLGGVLNAFGSTGGGRILEPANKIATTYGGQDVFGSRSSIAPRRQIATTGNSLNLGNTMFGLTSNRKPTGGNFAQGNLLKATRLTPSKGFSGITSAGPGFAGKSMQPFSKTTIGSKSPLDSFGDKFKELLSNPENLKKLFEEGKNLFSGGGGGDSGGGGGGGELPSSIEDLRSQLQSQGLAGPLAASMVSRLKELLDQPMTQMSADEEAAITRDIDKQQQQELDYVVDQYKNLRPGADIESDSSFRRDVGTVRDRYTKMKTDALAQARRQISQDYQRNLLNTLQLGQQAGEFTTSSLGNIGQLDLNRLMSQYGLSIDQAQRLQSMFGATDPLAAFRLGGLV